MKRDRAMAGNQHPLARVLDAIVKTNEDKMAKAARRLHDDVGQILSAAGLRLALLRMDLEGAAPELAQQLNESLKLLETAVASVRSLSYDLNPAIVERAGMAGALDRLARRYSDAFQGSIQLSCTPSVKLPAPMAAAVYRIVEAAVDNAVAHSGASRIEILVKDLCGVIMVEVGDNGRGFDCYEWQQNPSNIGFLFMRYHAEQGGMKLDISSKPGGGTIVKVECCWPSVS